MITYPDTTLGCPQRAGYQISKRNGVGILPALKGRPRSELLDIYSVYVISVGFDYGVSEYNGWQSFWRSLNNGVDWFQMNLILDVPTGTLMTVHATEPFSAQQTNMHRWRVTLGLEGIVS